MRSLHSVSIVVFAMLSVAVGLGYPKGFTGVGGAGMFHGITDRGSRSMHRYASSAIGRRQQRPSPLTRLHMAKGKGGKSTGSSSSRNNNNNNNSNSKKGFGSNPASAAGEGGTGDSSLASEGESVSATQVMEDDSNAAADDDTGQRLISNNLQDSMVFEQGEPDSFRNILRSADPVGERAIPPEIVFFGEPRQPPPVDAARELKYHGTLLMWARHATVAPRNSEERVAAVFPKGAAHPQASTYRLDNVNGALSFDSIFDSFVRLMDDLEASKAFLSANMDIVPSKMLLRALTARKLSLQSKGDLEGMAYLKAVRDRCILAHDQLFFPLNLEIVKSETRVMTYLARNELAEFSQNWDHVECSLHFTTLLAARVTWDCRVREVLADIKAKLRDTVEYMAARLEDDLMNRKFRKPGLTAQVYRNASKTIEETMPVFYAKVNPEVRFLNEVYDLLDLLGKPAGKDLAAAMSADDTLRQFAILNFCPKNSIALPDLLVRLRLYDATLAGIEDVDYIRLRLRVQAVTEVLAQGESVAADVTKSWYNRYLSDDKYGFETYEPDEVPTLIQAEQRIRNTGNAFTDFAVQVLRMPIKYTDALAGKRKKASEVGDWLFANDKETWDAKVALSYEDKLDEFRKAYMEQTRLRKDAEAKLTRMITNRMDVQDRAFTADWGKRVTQLSDE